MLHLQPSPMIKLVTEYSHHLHLLLLHEANLFFEYHVFMMKGI